MKKKSAEASAVAHRVMRWRKDGGVKLSTLAGGRRIWKVKDIDEHMDRHIAIHERTFAVMIAAQLNGILPTPIA